MVIVISARSQIPLVGRALELDRLHALLGHVRNGGSGALWVTGEPGIGKTSLLEAAVGTASGLRVLSISGYEVESSVAYGAIQRLGSPLAEYLPQIPERQRHALQIAAGLVDGAGVERSLVGLAGLSLLSLAAEGSPLLCVIDDAQHLDQESLEVLGFIARRLEAEAVGIVFASRGEDGTGSGLAGVPELRVSGLTSSASVELLGHVLSAPLDPAVQAEIIEGARGNPLALHELASDWGAHELTRLALYPSPRPVGRRLEVHYAQKVSSLPPESQLWILVAAAESTGNSAVVRSAARDLGLPESASTPVEQAGLVQLRDTVQFRHPLVRSAVYTSASDADRRSVHRALAMRAEADGYEEVAVWHAAAAAESPAAEVAERLIALAQRAGIRGGHASKARLLARAADMTSGRDARNVLLIDAAEAASTAGMMRLARELTVTIDTESLDSVSRGRLLVIRAMAAQFLADRAGLDEARMMLLRAADSFRGHAPVLEQRALLLTYHVIQSTQTEEDLDALPAFGRRLREAAQSAPGSLSVALRAIAALILDPYDDAVVVLRESVTMLKEMADGELIALSAFAVIPTVALWEADAGLELLDRAAKAAREGGALHELDIVLWTASAVELSRGNPAGAAAYLSHAADVRQAIGYIDQLAVNAGYLAWSGTDIATVRDVGDAMANAGFGGITRIASAGIAAAHLASGNYEDAYRLLRRLLDRPFLQASFHQNPDFVEACVRSGNLTDAAPAVALMRRFAAASGADWAIGMAARCDALVAADDEARSLYERSVEVLDRTGLIGERGRSRLLLGEWLRRRGLRAEAARHLSDAYLLLAQAGAVLFAERARRELRATGKIPPPITSNAMDDLTAQEQAVARLAAAGNTNAEIGEALFISVNTVDYHLRKVFRKLGVTSRRQLAASLGG
ncbi:AAA family ATPase [Microbacterium sp.]|uniref:helix-turn-helix transcriptional regulator n=1 Tax=Microbacterium sp. TaxID=51671 RepID=UPI003C77E322